MKISYEFEIENGQRHSFDLVFDDKTMERICELPVSPPEWTRFAFAKCPHCTAEDKWDGHCPLALHIHDLVERFDTVFSYDKVHVRVFDQSRMFKAEISAQRGLSSLLGLVIPSCGCPHTAFFRPMARFHLPFSDEYDTAFRVTGMYLLAQYMREQAGLKPDYSMGGIRQAYTDIEMVNRVTATRLRKASEADSCVNAIILLDFFAKAIPFMLDDKLAELEGVFEPFLK